MRHAVFQPVRLPGAVWTSAETEDLLRERRVGQLFLLAKKHAGASQARIAAATGLNQGEVSRIQRGDRWVTAIDVLERIADGFAMPDPARVLLGLAPSAGLGVIPAQLLPVVPGFVGRSTELAALKETGTGVVVITGPGGVGKTALALAWAHQAEFPDGQLYVDMRDCDPAEALAGFLRALGAPVPLTVRERAAQFRSLVASRRVLVVIDDAASAEQVRPLLPGGRGCLAVITSRDPLDSLVVRDGVARVLLDPLPPDEALELVIRVAGRRRADADPAAADHVVSQSAGMPLALRAGAVRLGERVDRPRRWPRLLGLAAALVLAVAAGAAGLSDVVDRATLHATVATRGGQLAALGLLVLAGCLAVLRPIAGLARPRLAAACLAGTAVAVVVAVAGRAAGGPPALVDTVYLMGVGVWSAVLAVTVMVLRALKSVAGYAVAIPAGVAGSWFVFGRLIGQGTATNHTYAYLLIAGAALVFAILGNVRPFRPAQAKHTVAAVVALLVVAVLATIPGPRARQRAYDSGVYDRHIESTAVTSQTGAEPISLTVEAGCDTSPCSLSPV